MSQAARVKLGPLDVIHVPGEPDGPAIVFFHGFGANAQDLYPLSGMLKAPAGANWYFPEGVLDLTGGMAPFASRAWWPIDQAVMEAAMASGSFRDFSQVTVPEQTRSAAQAMLDAIGVPLSRVTLGGFSQGAMLATELTLHAAENPAGLVMLSGAFLHHDAWRSKAPARKGLQFFQSHGKSDILLPFDGARDLEAMLREAGLSGEIIEFDGGHEIPEGLLRRLREYLVR